MFLFGYIYDFGVGLCFGLVGIKCVEICFGM